MCKSNCLFILKNCFVCGRQKQKSHNPCFNFISSCIYLLSLLLFCFSLLYIGGDFMFGCSVTFVSSYSFALDVTCAVQSLLFLTRFKQNLQFSSSQTSSSNSELRQIWFIRCRLSLEDFRTSICLWGVPELFRKLCLYYMPHCPLKTCIVGWLDVNPLKGWVLSMMHWCLFGRTPKRWFTSVESEVNGLLQTQYKSAISIGIMVQSCHSSPTPVWWGKPVLDLHMNWEIY